ncbi:MAG: GGDEF domain-containing protein [Lachnospiraceae bacterium]|nr:GGDEF domain-containing protein [Lachnospiraceae bacterium]
MNLQAILIANMFGLILLICVFISIILTKQNRRLSDKIFMALIFLVMAANVLESLTFYLDGKPGALNYYVNLFGSTYLYIANVTCGFLWTVYVDIKLYRSEERAKKRLPLYGILPVASIIALMINLFAPFIITVDENNRFRRLEWCWVMYLMIVIAAGMSIVIYCNYQRKYEKINFFPVWMFMIPVTTGSLAQGLFYGISTAWPSAAVGIAALHMSQQNEKSFIDPLTGLYNRLYLAHTLVATRGKHFYGIMLDLNFFKSINDTYGHSVGDRALNEVGKIIKKAMLIKNSIFRYAGDEYVIMLETNSESDVIDTEERIRAEVQKFNEESKEPYKLSFSMGHAKLEHKDTEDIFLHKIDTAMYIDKQRVHKQVLQAQG